MNENLCIQFTRHRCERYGACDDAPPLLRPYGFANPTVCFMRNRTNPLIFVLLLFKCIYKITVENLFPRMV